MEYPPITSTTNPTAKSMKALASKKGRAEQNAFLAEGAKIVQEALDSGLTPVTAFLLSSCQDAPLIELADRLHGAGARVFAVSDAVIQSAGDAQSSQPILASFVLPPSDDRSVLREPGLFLALDGLQDPGNLGATLRSADAMGVKAVLLGAGSADPYAPKSIRAAMGSTFHLPLLSCADLVADLALMKGEGSLLVAADLQGDETLPTLAPSTVLLIGNEGNGLQKSAIDVADARYRLPMPGRSESLNAAVCTGILLYLFSQSIPKR